MKVLITACLFAGFIVFPAGADIIYFKDGMKTICQERAWEEDSEIKCEYAGWTISYQKADILRIVKTTQPQEPPAPKNSAGLPAPPPAQIAAPPEKILPATQTTTPDTITKKIETAPKQPMGPVFYDPRRPYKYWADQNSKHKTYSEAIQALATKYKSTPAWVQAHMGDTNDLAQIHHNLAKPQTKEISPQTQPTASTTPEMVFYNPRRPYPYWTGTQSKYKSYKEAIQDLARKYDRSPEWIKMNMGATNDLNEIHANLAGRKAEGP